MIQKNELATLFGHDETAEARPDVTSSARVYLDLRRQVDDAEAALKTLRSRMDTAESAFLAKLDECGLSSVKLADGTALTSSTSNYYALPAGALEDASVMLWLIRMGGRDLVKRTIHHQSFSGFCRELAEDGKSMHPAVKLAQRRGVRMKSG